MNVIACSMPAGARFDPYRRIRHRSHLAPPDDVELAFALIGMQTVGDAVTAAAALQREHQRRMLRAAAAGTGRKAKFAVIPVDQRRAPLCEMKRRIPHQRAVPEHPDSIGSRRRASAARTCSVRSSSLIDGMSRPSSLRDHSRRLPSRMLSRVSLSSSCAFLGRRWDTLGYRQLFEQAKAIDATRGGDCG